MSLSSALLCKMMHSFLNVMFDKPDENDAFGIVEVMSHLFWRKNTRLAIHTRSGNGTRQTNVRQQKDDLMDKTQILTC